MKSPHLSKAISVFLSVMNWYSQNNVICCQVRCWVVNYNKQRVCLSIIWRCKSLILKRICRFCMTTILFCCVCVCLMVSSEHLLNHFKVLTISLTRFFYLSDNFFLQSLSLKMLYNLFGKPFTKVDNYSWII